jgi:hypothetical protein
MKLNYLKMLEDINKLVETDYCAELEMYLIPELNKDMNREIPQEDARNAIDIVSKVYSISHAIHCEPCASKYLVK